MTRACRACGESFSTERGDKRYCSSKCRMAEWMKTHERPAWLGKRRPRDPMQRKWAKLRRELETLGYERASEVVRLALADKAVEEITADRF